MTAAPAGAADAPALLDGLQLANALRAGIYRLFEQTDHLNKINVFPVPDGDTGTNLAMTLSTVLAALDRAPESDAGRLLARVADAALDGSRGNSGAILAQFLLGLADRTGTRPTLSSADLVQAVGTGAEYARDAMSRPQEGTLLTVLREFAKALDEALATNPALSPGDLLLASLEPARRSLAATTQQLDALRDAHVVDAGAQGFVVLLEGACRYLETGELGAAIAAPQHAAGEEYMSEGLADSQSPLHAPQRRYCTECLVTAPAGAAIDLRRLRETLSALGDSLVVGGNRAKAKVHLHTDDPERAFELVETFGALSGQKVDDMRRQQGAAHHRRAQRVAIVTDSAADIPDARLEALGIHVVPIRIHFGDRSYLDKVTMTPSEFYRELAHNPAHPKTSQPPPGDFRRMYEFLASHYEGVVSIALSSQASGTYNGALTASQRIAPTPEGRRIVSVLDSGSVSCGQGLIAIAAAERALAGGSADEVMETARQAARHTRAFALLASVDAAVKGGRVPPVARTLARVLNLSMILATQPDGRVKLGGALWGRHRLLERFARFVAQRTPAVRAPSLDSRETGATGPRYRVLIGHGDSAHAARTLSHHLATALPSGSIERSEITDMGTALGVHGGAGTLVVGLQAV